MTKPDFIYTTYIQSTQEKLWDALTHPEFTRQYWGGFENVSDWQPGSKWEHIAQVDKTAWIMGEVLESIPPRRLVLTWVDPDNLEDCSKVTFEIEPFQDVVRLTVVHGDFTTDSMMADKVSVGWPRVLSSLKSFIENGKPIDLRPECKLSEAKA